MRNELIDNVFTGEGYKIVTFKDGHSVMTFFMCDCKAKEALSDYAKLLGVGGCSRDIIILKNNQGVLAL